MTYADPNLKTPYTEQGDLTVEQKLDGKTTLDVAYLWNNGVDFLTRKDDNLKAPTSNYTYTILNASGAPVSTYTTPVYTASYNDPRYAVLNHIYNGGRLYYDGLAVSVNRRQSQWTQASLSYTWSHAIDLGQGAGADNIYYTDPPITVLNGNQRFEKGKSPLDQRHRLVVSGLVAVPKRSYGSRWLGTALNGWQISAIETYATPQGVDPQVVINGLPSAFANANSTTTLSGIGIGFASTQRVPFAPRSSVPLGDTIRTDGRLTKSFGLPREQSLTLNFEFFNVFNYSTITSAFNTAYYAYPDGRLAPYNTGNGDSSFADFLSTNDKAPAAATPAKGYASAGFPDGTNARRGQASVRYTF